MEAYSPTTNTWATVAPMPTARNELAVTANPDGRIYALAGDTCAACGLAGYSNAAEAYDRTTRTWATLAPIPTVRWGPAAASGSDGRVYLIGGDDGGYAGDVAAFAPSTGTWTTVASMITPRYSLAAATGRDGRIYAIGGYNPSGGYATVETYTP